MFHFYMLAIWAFIVWRLLLPTACRPALKAAVGLALLVLMQHHLVSRLVFSNMFSPEVPFAVLIVVAWGFATCVLLFSITVVLDAALFARRLGGWQPTGRQWNVMRLASLGPAMLGAGVGVYHAVQVPEVSRIEVVIDNLPSALDGITVVQLSDLHISRLLPAEWVAAVVARTNGLQPDLVLMTGDLIDGTVAARSVDVAPLLKLRAALGVIAVPGNHEYYFDEPAWRAALSKLGIRVLANEHIEVGDTTQVAGAQAGQRRPGTLVVAGINDAAARDVGLPGPDLAAALRGVRSDQPVILLAHRPADALAHAAQGIDLQLSGHTHGGMVRGFDAVVRWANEGYVSGLYQVAGMHLYVSNGTGIWNGFPIRIGVPAEITQFVLRARTPS